MPARQSLQWSIIGLICALSYALAIHALNQVSRVSASQEMQIAFPRFVQVAMAAGDRYLAANLAGFRVLVAETQNMKESNFAVQAKLQQDIAWLNPSHEDNYYIASAILPWNGQLEAAQYVLRRAIDGRPADWSPIFYYAFHIYHFKHDPATAAKWLLKAVDRPMSENDVMAVQNIAASWIQKGYQPVQAAKLIDAIADQSRSSGFKKYLHHRALRIRELEHLREAATSFKARFDRPPQKLEELVSTGILSALPKDPLGFGFSLDNNGNPIALNRPSPGK